MERILSWFAAGALMIAFGLRERERRKTEEQVRYEREQAEEQERNMYYESADVLFAYLKNGDDIQSELLEHRIRSYVEYRTKAVASQHYPPEDIIQYCEQVSLMTIPVDLAKESDPLCRLLRLLMWAMNLDAFGSCTTVPEMELAFRRGLLFLDAGLLTHILRLEGWSPYVNRFDWNATIGWILNIPATLRSEIDPEVWDEKMAICRRWDVELMARLEQFQAEETRTLKAIAASRLAPLKEELMAAAWHPKRVERWIEAGRWDLLDS